MPSVAKQTILSGAVNAASISFRLVPAVIAAAIQGEAKGGGSPLRPTLCASLP